jgi:biopolymer transport protein ExbD
MLVIEMTPMIDVIFLLLIYFFLSTTYRPPESRLSPALQAERVQGGAGADFTPQVVDVGLFEGRPGFGIGQRVVFDIETLTALLRRLPKEGGVFVRGSNDVETRWAIDALQAATDAEFLKVTYVPTRQ